MCIVDVLIAPALQYCCNKINKNATLAQKRNGFATKIQHLQKRRNGFATLCNAFATLLQHFCNTFATHCNNK
jgi:hypothetical protein